MGAVDSICKLCDFGELDNESELSMFSNQPAPIKSNRNKTSSAKPRHNGNGALTNGSVENGTVYSGELRKGKKHGKGEQIHPSGISEKGTWVNGEREGSFEI